MVLDDASPFLYHIGRPAAAKGVMSKDGLMRLTRRLLLEYSDKSEPHYTTILRTPQAWLLVGLGARQASASSSALPEALNLFCLDEARDIDRFASACRSSLPNLQTIATGAFFGGQTDMWEKASAQDTAGVPSPSKVSFSIPAERVARLVRNPQTQPVFCQRVSHGPLACLEYLSDSLGPGRPHVLHVDGPSRAPMPSVIGGKARWYCHFADVHDKEDQRTAINTLSYAVFEGYTARHRRLEQRPPLDVGKFDIDIYIPASWYETPHAGRLRRDIDMVSTLR